MAHQPWPVVLLPLGDTADVVAFGPPDDLDLLGNQRAEVPRPFTAAIRQAMATTPQIQYAADLMTGRVLRLTTESAKLLQQHQPLTKNGMVTGIVRGPDGKIAGLLTFSGPDLGLTALTGCLPAIGGGIAMQLQLARIEKALDEITKDLGYLVRQKHLGVEAAIETALEILAAVYRTVERRGVVEDDEWDRIAMSEPDVRRLHRLTRKNLRALRRALDAQSAPLHVRVAQLIRALRDERAEFWLRAHVHAELAVTRWQCLHLVRTAQHHPEELLHLIERTKASVESRQAELVELAQGLEEYIEHGSQVSGVVDRLRVISRYRMESLLAELKKTLDIYERELGGVGAPIEAGPPTPAVTDRDIGPSEPEKVLGRFRALPTGMRPVWEQVVSKLPMPVRRG